MRSQSPADLYPALTRYLGELSPEQRLVAACCRIALFPPEKEELRSLLGQGPDWGKVLRLADIYRAGPFLYRHLQEEKGVPPEVMDELRGISALSLASNAGYADLIKEIDGVFRDAVIPYALFKGGHLILEVYGTEGFRAFTDIDILVDAADIDRLDRVLRKEGFGLDRDRTASGYRARHMYEKGDICLDAHTGIFGRHLRNEMLGTDTADMLRRRRMI
ncbi:MAG: hypothetical protein GF392_06420, partial [Candidatus Omnitrophica bacterium]|nr:hypothetical protein [Candidatus Omnitrophota bacterium]